MQDLINSNKDMGIDEFGLAGIMVFKNYLLESDRAKEIDAILHKGVSEEMYRSLISELSTICKTRTVVKRNKVVRAGRSAIMGRLINNLTYTNVINYGLLGTSATAVTDLDTQLGAEIKRKPIASSTQTNDQVNIDFYYSKSDVSGTIEEFGTAIDGTTSANTGVLFNHVLTGGWTKTLAEAMTVSSQFNLNAIT